MRDPMITYDPAADLHGLTPGYEIKGARLQIKINSLGFPNRFISHVDEMRQELAKRDIPFGPWTFIVKCRRSQDRETQLAAPSPRAVAGR